MTKEQTTIRLPAELLQQLRKQADEMGVSFNAYVVMALEKGLKAMG